MFNTLEFARQKFPSLNAKEVAQIIAKSKLRKLKPGELFIKEGEVSSGPAYIAKGVMRSYVKVDGEEKTVVFRKDSEFIGALPSMFNDEPAVETVVAVENCIILTLDWKGFRQLAAKNSIIGRAYSRVIEGMMLESVDRIHEFTTLSAEQRYVKFIQENKDLLNRVQLRQVASYIGITEQSLSRMRARSAKNR